MSYTILLVGFMLLPKWDGGGGGREGVVHGVVWW